MTEETGVASFSIIPSTGFCSLAEASITSVGVPLSWQSLLIAEDQPGVLSPANILKIKSKAIFHSAVLTEAGALHVCYAAEEMCVHAGGCKRL